MAAKFDIEELMEEQVEALDDAIAKIDKRMGPYEKLAAKKQQLLAARRALLNSGPRLTGGTSTKLHLEDIVQFLKENPGAAPGQIAERFGVTQPTVSSHLYRNKTKFIAKDGRYWVRSPKDGLDTADDIEEDD